MDKQSGETEEEEVMVKE